MRSLFLDNLDPWQGIKQLLILFWASFTVGLMGGVLVGWLWL